MLIDPQVSGVETVSYYLFKGVLAHPPVDATTLADARSLDGAKPRWELRGGDDATGLKVLDDVESGDYTVCVQVGQPIDHEAKRVMAEVVAERDVELGSDFPAVAEEVDEEVTARLGRSPTRYAESDERPRCRSLTVAEDPSSRVFALSKADETAGA